MKKIIILMAVLAALVFNFGNCFAAYELSEEDLWGDMSDVGGEAGDDDMVDVGGDVADKDEEAATENFTGTVYLLGKLLDGDILKVSVAAKDMEVPVLGMAFHLNYDGDKISFLKYEPGKFLEIGGDPFYLVQNDSEKAELVFGETLRRNDSFPLGGDVIADFYFQINEGEEFSFNFKNGIVSSIDSVRQDIDKINFEDAIINKSGENILGEKTLGKASVLNSGDNTTGGNFFKKYFSVTLVFVALFVSFIIIVLIKKWRMIRHA